MFGGSEGDSEIVVNGYLPTENVPTGFAGLMNIVADMIRDNLEQQLAILESMFAEIGIFDLPYLANLYLGGQSNTSEPIKFDNELTAVGQAASVISANTAFDGLSGTKQPEYGNVIVEDNGKFIVSSTTQGESYSDHNPPRTHLSSPTDYSWAQVVALVHSHPPSGSSAIDALNIRPSDGDWEAADRITGNFPGHTQASYANASTLTLYIIDRDGTVRAFDYRTPTERGAAPGHPGNQSSATGTIITAPI